MDNKQIEHRLKIATILALTKSVCERMPSAETAALIMMFHNVVEDTHFIETIETHIEEAPIKRHLHLVTEEET
tara:strand:+ start:414 stop:632 length:219 start_codon:yes stop_codon:yes gene_type:complete